MARCSGRSGRCGWTWRVLSSSAERARSLISGIVVNLPVRGEIRFQRECVCEGTGGRGVTHLQDGLQDPGPGCGRGGAGARGDRERDCRTGGNGWTLDGFGGVRTGKSVVSPDCSTSCGPRSWRGASCGVRSPQIASDLGSRIRHHHGSHPESNGCVTREGESRPGPTRLRPVLLTCRFR